MMRLMRQTPPAFAAMATTLAAILGVLLALAFNRSQGQASTGPEGAYTATSGDVGDTWIFDHGSLTLVQPSIGANEHLNYEVNGGALYLTGGARYGFQETPDGSTIILTEGDGTARVLRRNR